MGEVCDVYIVTIALIIFVLPTNLSNTNAFNGFRHLEVGGLISCVCEFDVHAYSILAEQVLSESQLFWQYPKSTADRQVNEAISSRASPVVLSIHLNES